MDDPLKISKETHDALMAAKERSHTLRIALGVWPGMEGVARACLYMIHTEERLVRVLASKMEKDFNPQILVAESTADAIRFGIEQAIKVAERVESGEMTTTKTVVEALNGLLEEPPEKPAEEGRG